MKSLLSRRELMALMAKTTGLVVGSQYLPFSLQARAETSAEPHFFLLLKTNGGWDVTLAMDSKLPADMTQQGIDETDFYRVYTEDQMIKVADRTYFGPAAASLVPYFQDLCVVNGVLMLPKVTNHEINRAYMAIGNSKPDDPYFPFQLAMTAGDAPMGVAHRLEYVDQLRTGSYTSKIAARELTQAQGGGLQDLYVQALMDKITREASENGTNATIDAQRLSLEAQAALASVADKFKEFREKYFDGTDEGDGIAATLAGFNAGVIRYGVVDYQSDYELDTHSSHSTKHPLVLGKALSRVAATLKCLKETPYAPNGVESGKSLFDYTTVMVVSEFARTPWNQGGDGTDHNPYTNSCLMFGKRIQGGQVIGNSRMISRKDTSEQRSRLQANLFDFKNNTPISDETFRSVLSGDIKVGACSADLPQCLDFIMPGTLMKTMAKAFGVDDKAQWVSKSRTLDQILRA